MNTAEILLVTYRPCDEIEEPCGMCGCTIGAGIPRYRLACGHVFHAGRRYACVLPRLPERLYRDRSCPKCHVKITADTDEE